MFVLRFDNMDSEDNKAGRGPLTDLTNVIDGGVYFVIITNYKLNYCAGGLIIYVKINFRWRISVKLTIKSH